MAKRKTIPQNYPRIQDETHPYYGYLDESALVPHFHKIPVEELKEIIASAIVRASLKSSREILSIPLDATQEEIDTIYETQGKELFKYFKKYVSDPAYTAYQMVGRHYKEVGLELFRRRTLQMERMNAGWRYQYIAFECASRSQRFHSLSDRGAKGGDFNAVINFLDSTREPLSLYVSIKNRSNTIGGQDFPKAIQALEDVAKNDKNRTGPYCCIFGITIEKGLRNIRHEQSTGIAYSPNTEVWLSDFFWRFFTNYAYEEIMLAVLEVFIELYEKDNLAVGIFIPDRLLNTFGDACFAKGLLDNEGYFDNRHRLVQYFCGK